MLVAVLMLAPGWLRAQDPVKTDSDKYATVAENIPYKVDILRLDETELEIRSHNPGGAVDIRLVPAARKAP